jgi:hypothetical protein
MAMFRFVPPFREAKFCGVPSYVFDKLGCAVGEKRLRNTDVDIVTKHADEQTRIPMVHNHQTPPAGLLNLAYRSLVVLK